MKTTPDRSSPISSQVASACPCVSVTCEDGWLVAACEMSGSCPPAERLIGLNGSLPGPAKFCLTRDGTPLVRMEIPLSDEEDLAKWSRTAEAAVCTALASLCQSDMAIERAQVPTAEPADIPDVTAICASLRWPSTKRQPGRWMVTLDCTPFCQAEVSVSGSDLVMVVPLGAADPADAGPCAEAVAHLLLRGSGALRMIRAGATVDGSELRLSLAARLQLERVSADLDHYLCALSVAARSLLREVRALRDPVIARAYLAMRHPPVPDLQAPRPIQMTFTKEN